MSHSSDMPDRMTAFKYFLWHTSFEILAFLLVLCSRKWQIIEKLLLQVNMVRVRCHNSTGGLEKISRKYVHESPFKIVSSAHMDIIGAPSTWSMVPIPQLLHTLLLIAASCTVDTAAPQILPPQRHPLNDCLVQENKRPAPLPWG